MPPCIQEPSLLIFLSAFRFGDSTEAGHDHPALIDAVGRDIVASQQEEYIVRPVFTGQKGGGFLVELMTTIQHVATTFLDDHMVLAEGIADLSGLVTIFTGLSSVLKQIHLAYEKRVGKEESIVHPIKIIINIDGASLKIEGSDLTQANAALQLALKYRSAHPTKVAQVTGKSMVKVQGKVPARKKRLRR